MNILKTPPTHNELNNSCSLSGVTLLKNGRYNLRHVGSKNLVVLPDGTIEKHSNRCTSTGRKSQRKQRLLGVHSETDGIDSFSNDSLLLSKKVRTYSLKKSLIRNRIFAHLNQQKGTKELYFFTVTFPPIVTDDLAYKFFNQWLTVLRMKGILRSYLWVAERQSNGTIHYHIAITHRMYAPKANKEMVTILSNAVRKNQLNWNLQAAKRYNGVDIAKDRKYKRVTNFAEKKRGRSLSNYLTKYITKNDHQYTHYCWHCSRDFSNLVIKISFTNEELLTCNFEAYLSDRILFETEHCIFIPWVNYPPPKLTEYLSKINELILSKLN